MAKKKRVDLRGALANTNLRRDLMVPTIQATQAREGIDTTPAQAERAYYVVTEGERTAFFNLKQFRGGRKESDGREAAFVKALWGTDRVRFDLVRGDFTSIDGAPLSYERIGLISPLFRQYLPVAPHLGETRIGHQTFDDERFVRFRWEVPVQHVGAGRKWPPFAKGGEFSRFYSDVHLVVRWDEQAHSVYSERKSNFNVLLTSSSATYLHRPGLTWPRRTAKGFNLRWMPPGCIFGDKGPAFFPLSPSLTGSICAILNSSLAEFIMGSFTSFSWEAGVLQRVPVPPMTEETARRIGILAEEIRDSKSSWNEGNENSSNFRIPWLLHTNLIDADCSLAARLTRLSAIEATEEARIQQVYAELNDEIYKLYGIPESTRATIEETLGERPPEILWPQMEAQSVEQKRMEHVFRLLSYAVNSTLSD